MSFCKQVCPYITKRSKEWSTWRGLMIGTASIIAVFNPVLGLAVVKVFGTIIGGVDVLKDESKP